jgi:hypothetical protein
MAGERCDALPRRRLQPAKSRPQVAKTGPDRGSARRRAYGAEVEVTDSAPGRRQLVRRTGEGSPNPLDLQTQQRLVLHRVSLHSRTALTLISPNQIKPAHCARSPGH